MSLSLVLQTKDQIIISGDSRASIQKRGITYAADDGIQKLYHIDNKIFFTGGSQWVAEESLNRYKNSEDKSIDALNEIGRQVVKEYEKLCPDTELERLFELIVATFEEGVSVLFSLSSYEGYRITKIVGSDELTISCAGSYRNQVMALYKSLELKMTVPEIYRIIYDVFSSEEMGGSLTVCVFTEKGVHSYKSKINDFRPIKRYASNNLSENVCTIGPVHGFESMLSDKKARAYFNADALKMQKGDGTGNNWEDVLFFDAAEQIYKFVGSLIIGGKIMGVTGDEDYAVLFVGDYGGSIDTHNDNSGMKAIRLKPGFTSPATACGYVQFLEDGSAYLYDSEGNSERIATQEWVTSAIASAISAHITAYHSS